MRLLFLILLFCLSFITLFAGDKTGDVPWHPESPQNDVVLDFEWIKLKGGEWLKGEILSLRDDTLIFDSDKFGDHLFKWEDVHELYSIERMTVVLFDGRVITSRLSIIDGEVSFLDKNETVSRDLIISFVPTNSNWWKLWNGRISAGLNLRRGNTDQTDLQFNLDLIRRSAFNRLNLSYTGNFSYVKAQPIVSNNKAVFGWNYFISHRMYLIPISYTFFSDPFRNIRQQHTPSIGFGYEIVNRTKIDWNLLGGGGYRYIEYYSVESGLKDFTQSVVLHLGTNLTADLTDSTEIDFSYTVNFDLMNLKNIGQNLSALLYVDITNNLELDLMFTWSRVGDPERREDGTLPQKDDLSLSTGVNYKF